MNLFRSEEHARNWAGFTPEAEGGLLPLQAMLDIFSAPYFQQRLSGRYISDMDELRPSLMEAIGRNTGGHPFWSLTPP